jgi:predicted nucleic-acid-binding Zn-ribbon protein
MNERPGTPRDFQEAVNLTDEQMEAAEEWLQNKGIGLKCSQCPGEMVLESTLANIPHRGKTDLFQNNGQPVVSLFCSQCGNLQFYSAALMGILDHSRDQKSPK